MHPNIVNVYDVGEEKSSYYIIMELVNGITLKKYIENGKATWEIQEQFLRWVKAGGKKIGGLVSRRIWEAARFAE
jgi:GH24 family phage-related lysozyme (muramidase)